MRDSVDGESETVCRERRARCDFQRADRLRDLQAALVADIPRGVSHGHGRRGWKMGGENCAPGGVTVAGGERWEF